MPTVGSGRVTPGTGAITYTGTDSTSIGGATGSATTSSSSTSIVRTVTGNNLGDGFGVFAGTNGSTDVVLDFKSLLVGSGLSIVEDASTITFSLGNSSGNQLALTDLSDGPSALVPNGILTAVSVNNLSFTAAPTAANTILNWTGASYNWVPLPLGTVTSVNANGTNGISVSGGPITSSGALTIGLTPTGVTAGNYTAPTITVDANGRITAISSNVLGEINDGSNLGGGAGIYVGKSGSTLQFKSIRGVGNVVVSSSGTEIAITSTGSVTSVDGIGSNGISVSGGPITSSGALTIGLTNTGVTAGSYTSADITVDATGRVTSIANGSPGVTSVNANGSNGISISGGPITSTGSLNISLTATGVSAGTFTNPTIVVDNYGRITSAASNSIVSSASNLGSTGNNSGYVFASLASQNLAFRRIVATGGLTLTQNSTDLIIDASNFLPVSSSGLTVFDEGGSVGTNVGTINFVGQNVQATVNGGVATVNVSGVSSITATGQNGISVTGGTAGQITSSGTYTIGLTPTGVSAASYTFPTLTVDAYGRITSATSITPSNLGTGNQVLADSTNMSFRSLIAGNNITITETSTDLTISSVGGGVTSIDASGINGVLVVGGPITTTGSLTIGLTNSGVTAGSYVAPTILVDATGRITSAVSNTVVNGVSNLGASGSNIGYVLSDVTGGTANLRRIMVTGGLTLTQGSDALVIDASGVTGGGSGGVSSVAVTGSSNISVTGSPITSSGTIGLDLSTTGVTAGTYTSVTVDQYGRVIAGSTETESTITVSGDASGSGTSAITLTLASVNLNTGAFGSTSVVPVITVNDKGLVTAVSTATITPSAIGAAPLANPTFTGSVNAPTPSVGDNSTLVATTAFVNSFITSSIPSASTTTPFMDGTAAIGTGTTWARADHVHPSDTTKADIASPTFTGNPSAPTATSTDNSSSIATTAFVNAYVNSKNYLTANQTITASGDVTGSGTTSLPLTLATVNTNTGAFGSTSVVPVITVNGKGLVTAVSTATITPSAIGAAPIANPTFTGLVNAPTPSTGDNSTLVATTAFVKAQGYVTSSSIPSASTTTPFMDGTAAIGTGTTWARADHVHPSDTTKADIASPTFTGNPTAPTPSASDNSTSIATTAWVKSQGYGTGGGTITVSGDASGSGTSAITLTLASVNSNTGSYGSTSVVPVITVNGKGLVTAVSTATITPSAIGAAPLASPAFTGTPTAPTVTSTDNSTSIATTAFVASAMSGFTASIPQASVSLPSMDGTAAIGTGSTWARADHVHPSDTTKANIASPTFTGTPAAPTPTATDNSTTLATTAFVKSQNYLTANQTITASGDVTGAGTTSLPLTLATVNSNVGTFTNATVTVDAKGRITAVSSGSGGSGSAVPIEQNGTSIVPAPTAINFTGSGVTVSNSSGVATVNIPSASAPTGTGTWYRFRVGFTGTTLSTCDQLPTGWSATINSPSAGYITMTIPSTEGTPAQIAVQGQTTVGGTIYTTRGETSQLGFTYDFSNTSQMIFYGMVNSYLGAASGAYAYISVMMIPAYAS